SAHYIGCPVGMRLKLTLLWTLAMGLVLAVSAYILFTRQLWNRLDTALVEEADAGTLAFAHGGLERVEEIGRQLAREHDRPKRRVRVWRDGCLLGDFGEGDLICRNIRSARLPACR